MAVGPNLRNMVVAAVVMTLKNDIGKGYKMVNCMEMVHDHG